MTDEEAARRRILDRDGYSRRLVLGIREADASIVVGAALLGLFITSLVGLDGLALPVTLLGGVVGLATVYVAPDHRSASAWIADGIRYCRRPDVTLSDTGAARGNSTSNRDHLPLLIDEEVSDLTAVRGGWPDRAAIRRTDGAVEALLELTPANMDFATSADWERVQTTAATFANEELSYPLTVRATSRAFPVDRLVDDSEDDTPEESPDDSPVFELEQSYRETRPETIRKHGTREVRYFLGVSVNELEIYDRTDEEHTPLEKLARLPILGIPFTPLITRRNPLEAEERDEAMLDRLDARVEHVERELVDRIDGWAARRVPTAELLTIGMEFWTGSDPDYDTRDRLVRERRTLGRMARAEASQAGEKPTKSSPDSHPDTTLDGIYADLIGPDAVEWETRAARLPNTWTRTLSIAGYPDYPTDGYLSELFELTNVSYDLAVHLAPKSQASARQELRETADDLHAETNLEVSSRQTYLNKRAAAARSTAAAVEGGERVFEQAILLTIRADSREELRRATRRVRSTLRDEPATLTPRTAICRQDLGLRSVAPFGGNHFGREVTALGGAVGALLASAHEATLLEPGGVEVGIHRGNRSPVVVDQFARDDGYASFIVGDTGSGKSFSAKQQFVRSLQADPDRIGIILEPLNNWAGVADALDADRVTIGGTRGLNPLEIHETPADVLESLGADASPFNEKLDDVLGFFANFFALREIELGDRRPTLEAALLAAYERNGITADVATHGNESPTIRDVLDVLEGMAEAPDQFVVRSDAEAGKLRADATWLLDQLRPFTPGGRYENLGRPSELDLSKSDLLYLDLAQQEGTSGGSAALTMQLLITRAYELAKKTEQEVVFVIDEARYLMQHAAHLGFLETVFRHHRHHDLSIRLITQTVDEFFEHAESEAILDQCSVKQFHRLDGMDEELAAEFGLNHAQMRYVQNALPGSEETGYSEALLGVDGEWRGIEVHATDEEESVIG